MAFLPAKKEHSLVLWLQTFLTLNCLSGEIMTVSAAKLFALTAASIQLKRSERMGGTVSFCLVYRLVFIVD